MVDMLKAFLFKKEGLLGPVGKSDPLSFYLDKLCKEESAEFIESAKDDETLEYYLCEWKPLVG